MAKIIGALLALIGAMVLTLYKGVSLTQKTTHLIRPLHTTNMGTNNSPKKWMLGSIALLRNAFSFSFWMLLQSKGTAASGIGFVLLTWAVQKRGPVFTSSFLPLVQVFVGLIDSAVLHEPLYFGSVLGAILLIIGLYVLLWGKRKEVSISSIKLHEANQQQQEYN